MIFGDMLRLYIASEGFNMRDVGAAIGVSASTVSRICNGEMPDAQTLIKLINWMFKKDRNL